MLRFPETVQDLLVRRYRNCHRNWLAGDGRWPLQVGLGCPTEEEARDLPNNLPAWVQAWREWKGPGQVAWCERRWRSLGVQRLPERLILSTPDDAVLVAGDDKRWRQASSAYRTLVSRWPSLTQRAARWYDALAGFDNRDTQTLESLLGWLAANPASRLFPRQLPIPGMDTKWLEPRLHIAADLLAAIRGEDTADMNVYESCGLQEVPTLVRFRLLDAALRRHVGGMGDIATPLTDLSALTLDAEHVYIVENLQTGMAFPERKGAIVIMGLGYAVSALAKVPWIAAAPSTYWGDLDTHGLSMLNRARTVLPQIQSVLMDKPTLLRYRDLWVTEGEQSTLEDLPLLTGSERTIYQELKEQRWGRNVRLEQERIPWIDAIAELDHMSLNRSPGAG